MAKMTPARAGRWNKAAADSLALVRKALTDLGDAKMSVTGASHTDVVEIAQDLQAVEARLARLADPTSASPISRVQDRLVAAAQARKEAKARKAAERLNPGEE